MKKVWKWVLGLAAVLCLIMGVFLTKIYSDLKTTAQEIYTPLPDELSALREQAVDLSSKEPFSALLLGVDEREGDIGRSDTMIVLTVNPTLKTTKMLSIPRDTYTQLDGKSFKDKINHAYTYGGIQASVKTVETLLDIPIDYVARVNMESFKDIIEIVGGITVENSFDFFYEGEFFKQGKLDLDGEMALKFVRMRYEDPEGDFGRQNRQKKVIQAVIKNGLSLNTVVNYKSIFNVLEQNVELNSTFDEILDIRKNYASSLTNIDQLYMNNGSGKILNGIYYYVPNEKELSQIQDVLREHLQL